MANFFFTSNYADLPEKLLEDFEKFRTWLPEMCSSLGTLRAACVWEERGCDTGNPHMHGVIILRQNKRMRVQQVADLLVDTCSLSVRPHVEVCRSVPAAIAYRDKPEKAAAWQRWGPVTESGGRLPYFFRVGERFLLEPGGTGKGARTDIRSALEAAPDYATLVQEHPEVAMRGRRVAMDYYMLREKGSHRESVPEVSWIYGGPGVGKSRLAVAYARSVSGNDYFIHLPGPLKWWDGYLGEPTIIIDDGRKGDVLSSGGLNYLLRVLDRYDLAVEIKGGTTKARWTRVIITSPNDPVSEFTYHRADGGERVDENIGQLIRRLARVVELRAIGGMVQEIDHTASLRERYCLPESVQPLQHSQLFGVDL